MNNVDFHCSQIYRPLFYPLRSVDIMWWWYNITRVISIQSIVLVLHNFIHKYKNTEIGKWTIKPYCQYFKPRKLCWWKNLGWLFGILDKNKNLNPLFFTKHFNMHVLKSLFMKNLSVCHLREILKILNISLIVQSLYPNHA